MTQCDCTHSEATSQRPTQEAHALLIDGGGVRPPIHIRHFAALLFAYLKVMILLKTRSLEHIARRVKIRKERHTAELDMAHARRLMTAYYSLRPLVFTAKSKCLLDSLTLLEFLAQYSIFPTWITGVTVRPFHAHTWVQEQGLVFNETVERARNHTAIMVI